jgi:hypothetical protein
MNRNDETRREQIRRELYRDVSERQKSYRMRALSMYPHVCASCGRSFEGARLRELTVHHKDHNHSNNPPDGSNWELLCLYCHDHEHEKHKMAGVLKDRAGAVEAPLSGFGTPFEQLGELLKTDEENNNSVANPRENK